MSFRSATERIVANTNNTSAQDSSKSLTRSICGVSGGSSNVGEDAIAAATTASGVSILLSDWSRFGIAERASYHFDLIETLTPSSGSWSSLKSPQQNEQQQKPETAEGNPPRSVASVEGTGYKSTSKDAQKKVESEDETDIPSPSRLSACASAPASAVSPIEPPPDYKLCGVVGLLECVPSVPPEQLRTSRQRHLRRILRARHRVFNQRAQRARSQSKEDNRSLFGAEGKQHETDNAEPGGAFHRKCLESGASERELSEWCYRPCPLPLPLSIHSRVAFAYELTSMVLCLDASPTLTSMFVPTRYSSRILDDEMELNSGGEQDKEEEAFCAMDKFEHMVRTYLTSLVEPISLSASGGSNRVWAPEIAVTVVAVYSQDSATGESLGGNTSVLVKDYRLHDVDSASHLAAKLGQWATEEVEWGIATRLNSRHGNGGSRGGGKVLLPSVSSSSMLSILEACDAALSTLPPEGRPCAVLATTCRSVRCHDLVDFASDPSWRDIPVHILDLSSSGSPARLLSSLQSPSFCSALDITKHRGVSSMRGDDGRHAFSAKALHEQGHFSDCAVPDVMDRRDNAFGGYGSVAPLWLSDDREALHDFCSHVTGGRFWDLDLLREAVTTRAGQVPPHSAFHSDYYLVFRRRALKPNALQWYTLFCLSPLTPLSNVTWGRPPPPTHMRKAPWMQQQQHLLQGHANRERTMVGAPLDNRQEVERQQQQRDSFPPLKGFDSDSTYNYVGNAFHNRKRTLPTRFSQMDSRSLSSLGTAGSRDIVGIPNPVRPDLGGQTGVTTGVAPTGSRNRITFSIYSLSPVRVKGMLLMRFVEGFRARKYGYATQYNDKLSIALSLPLDRGVTIHYELSFVSSASPGHDPMVGSAHVKMELSSLSSTGEDTGFIQMVKNDFISHQTYSRKLHGPSSAVSGASGKLCKFLRWIRKEDCLESYLCPLEWCAMNRPLNLRRLETLTAQQRRRHFRMESFEVICVGGEAVIDDHGILEAFVEVDHGEKALLAGIASWSTTKITGDRLYMKNLSSGRSSLPSYCFVDISQSEVASRLYIVNVGFNGVGEGERLRVLESLKLFVSSIQDVVVLPRPLSRFLVHSGRSDSRAQLIEKYYHHESWDLLKDPELLPLLTKRRTQIGKFWLVDGCVKKQNALFVKISKQKEVSEGKTVQTLALVQYQINIRTHHVTVDVHMDTEAGYYPPWMSRSSWEDYNAPERRSWIFNRICKIIKKRDQVCAKALRSRGRLLSLLCGENVGAVQGTRSNEGRDSMEMEDQVDDVLQLLAYSSQQSKNLRFFRPGSGPANKLLSELTANFLLSDALRDLQVARLSIGSDVAVGDQEPGTWFIIRHDSSTITLVHFSSVDHTGRKEEGSDGLSTSVVHRSMKFFTSGIGDLYSTKDDTTEDDTDDDDVSEHLDDVSEVVEALGSEHNRNFSRAAYLALRSKVTSSAINESVEFAKDDFLHALSFCEKIEVATAYLLNSGKSSRGEKPRITSYGSTDLYSLIGELLKPVPGMDNYFYFCGTEIGEDDLFADDVVQTAHRKIIRRKAVIDDQNESDSDDLIDGLEKEDDATTTESDGDSSSRPSKEDFLDSSHLYSNSSAPLPPQVNSTVSPGLIDSIHSPPLFVHFLLDGESASSKDIAQLDRSSHLTALMTVFPGTVLSSSWHSGSGDDLPTIHELPKIHCAVSIALRSKLDAFVAAQTLERLRHVGTSLSEVDLKVAMKCIVEAERVASRNVPVEFFSARADSMVAAVSNASDGSSLLTKELSSGRLIRMQKATHGALYVTEVTADGDSLSYWAFLHQIKRHGCISINVHHPSGMEAAENIANKLEDIVVTSMCRVNQLLLLDSLHVNRSSSQLLIPGDSIPDNKRCPRYTLKTSPVHARDLIHCCILKKSPGHFACPVVFSTRFSLNHRFKQKSCQVKLELESSVLHQFAVSNRTGVFVYKNGKGHIFYMMLKTKESDESIELLVHGVDAPGGSITHQLRRLLQKKLMTLAVEALSSVLNKNPHYNLLPADMVFLTSYATNWGQLESAEDDSPATGVNDRVRLYEFPARVHDPLMVLLYYRQNISGSTYFHLLHEAGDHASGESEVTACTATDVGDAQRQNAIDQGMSIPFIPRDFRLFYNNTPTYLDPKFQAVCTLTRKGRNYATQTGTGIALVNVFLLNGDGTPALNANVGTTPGMETSCAEVPVSSLRFRRCNENDKLPRKEDGFRPFRVSVEIVNTTLSLQVLHEWVELSLNQALVGWFIERHLERSRLSLFTPKVAGSSGNDGGCCRANHESHLDAICPGLPALCSMLQSSFTLPHPAVETVEFSVLRKATELAGLTIEILDRAICGALLCETSMTFSDFRGMIILRCIRFHNPKQVNLKHCQKHGKPVLIDESGAELYDGPTENPEYICAFGLRSLKECGHSEGQETSIPSSCKVFHEVMTLANSKLSSGATGSVKALAQVKATNRSAFARSLSFVLKVSRSKRSLFCYNWHPNVVQEASQRFQQVEERFTVLEIRHRHAQQSRCFKSMPFFHNRDKNKTVVKLEKESDVDVPVPTSKQHEKGSDPTGNLSGVARGARRLVRPRVIRRPKLIGQSVEGAAMQAMLASRARASSRLVHGHRKASATSLVTSSAASVTTQRTSDHLQSSKSQREHQESVESLLESVGVPKRQIVRPSHRRVSSSTSSGLGSGTKESSQHEAPDRQVLGDVGDSSKRHVSSSLPSTKSGAEGRTKKSDIPPNQSQESISQASVDTSLESLLQAPARQSYDTTDTSDISAESAGRKSRVQSRKTKKGQGTTAILGMLKKILHDRNSSSERATLSGKVRRLSQSAVRDLFKQAEVDDGLLLSILSLATLVKTVTGEVMPFLSGGTKASDARSFLDCYVRTLMKRFGFKIMRPEPSLLAHDLRKESIKGSQGEAPIYLRRKIVGEESSLLVLELALIKDGLLNKTVVRCLVWLTPEFKNKGRQKFIMNTNTARRKQGRRKDELMVHFCRKLMLQTELFNYACSGLENYVQSTEGAVQPPVGSLIREISQKYSVSRQKNLPGMKYRALCRLIPIANTAPYVPAGVTSGALMSYIFSRVDSYGTIKGGTENDRVLMGKVAGIDTCAYFFIMHRSDAYEAFILCDAEEKSLDIVVRCDAITIQIRADRIVDMVVTFVYRMLRNAALYLRRDHIWEEFARPPEQRDESPSIFDLQELCDASSVISISQSDPRLSLFLVNSNASLRLDWSAICRSLEQEHIFLTHSFTRSTLVELRYLLVRFRETEEVFLLVEIDDEGQLKSLRSIIKDGDDFEGKMRRTRVVERFVNWLLQWIWHHV